MAVRPLTCPFSRRSAASHMWYLWLLLAALLVLPVVAVLVEDRPPPNEITQDDRDGDAEMRTAA